MMRMDIERAMEAPVDAQSMLQELAVLFKYFDPKQKRVEGIIVPTDESLEILEDYLSRWSWIIVQKLSEPGTVTPEFAPEDANLSLQDAVIEMVLYGVAYLAARRSRPVDEIIPSKEGADETKNIGPGATGPLGGKPVSLTPFSDACKRLDEEIEKLRQEDIKNGIQRPKDYFYWVKVNDVIGHTEPETDPEKEEEKTE